MRYLYFSILMTYTALIGHFILGHMPEAPIFYDTHTVAREKENVEELEQDMPDAVRAVYLTRWSVSMQSRINHLKMLAKKTELNAVVIDVKDSEGLISYSVDVPTAKQYGATTKMIGDIDAFIEELHNEDIYVIGRVAVFQDPVLANARPGLALRSASTRDIWRDNKGLMWVDPSSKEAWDYNISIARDAHEKGFDEINFDYIRFPSDGNMSDIVYPLWRADGPRVDTIREFHSYVRDELQDVTISADLFGLVTVSESGDLGIGQRLEDALPYYDYISPMVYPSHYTKGFRGYSEPAQHPYEVVNMSMERAQERLEALRKENETSVRFRPWLQYFDHGGRYRAPEIKAQIDATRDAVGYEYEGFLLWNPRNIYPIEIIEESFKE